ncbi:MAG: FixH family protein [Endozoicomonas sp.]
MTHQNSPANSAPPTGRGVGKEPFTPWYREPWAWYIVGILLVTFCWGSFQLYTALSNQDSVVIDDYYKNGKAINHDRTRNHNARTLGVQAMVTIDNLVGEVRVAVQGSLEEWPEQLTLSFLSPVFKKQDKTLTLKRSVSGEYVGQLQELVAGRYYLQLETQDTYIPEVGYETGWKVTMETAVTPGEPINLYPAVTQ